VKDDLRVATFMGNAYTKKQDAVLFAKFRAVEWCQSQDKKLAYILGVNDNSETQDVIRTSSSGWPSYYYGMSPYYGHFNSGLGLGFSHMSSNSWEESYVYPRYDVVYECQDVVWGPEIIFREATRDEMKLLVKDFKGGLQIEKILPGSPNRELFDEGDVLVRANNIRIESVSDLLHKFKADKNNLQVSFFREGIKRSAPLRSKNITEQVEKSQREIIKAACRKKELKESHRLCLKP
jgi:hypothetical protein